MTAWTTTAHSAARLQPVEEELMWLKVFRGCGSRSISLNAFFTPNDPDDRECDLLASRLMTASQMICRKLKLFNAGLILKLTVCRKHPTFGSFPFGKVYLRVN